MMYHSQNLSLRSSKFCLLKVICDEGHLLKNDKAAVTSAVNKIVTKRRIILTGNFLYLTLFFISS